MQDTELRRREEILEAVLALVVSEGVDNLTIRSVADEVGVSTGLILYYFKTKKELMAAAWAHADTAYRERVLEMAGGARGMRQLEAHFRGCFPERDEDMPAWSYWMELWALANHDEDLRQIAVNRFNQQRLRIAGQIAEGIGSGEVSSDLDPLLVAELFKVLDYGLIVAVSLQKEGVHSARAFEIADLVLSLIKTDSVRPPRHNGRASA